MTNQEEIREGIVRNAYLWHSLSLLDKATVEPFEKLTEEEQKPYYALAYQLSLRLHSQGVVIKVERELPDKVYYDRFMTGAGQWNKEGKETGYKDAQEDMIEAGYVAVESLIEE